MANNRPGQRAVLPALPENALSKKSVNPETDGLELCKQAVALLVGDLRAEVQQAVGQLKGEANAAKNPLGSKLLNVADGLQQAEKDALGRMRELLTHSHWDLGQRLDQQMQVNALLGDHLGASRDLTVGTVANLEQCMKRLEANVSREYGEMRSELSRVKEIVTNISSQVERETLAIQEQNTQQAANVEGRLLEELGLVRSEVENRILASSNQVSSALRQLENQTIQCNEGIGTIITAEHQLKAIADGITAEVLRLQQQDDKHYVDLGQNLDVKIANQDEHLLTILQQNDSFITLPQDVSRLRRKVNEDIRLVLGEITRVQKALQVDYLPPSKLRSNSRKLSDGHRRSREEMATVAVQLMDVSISPPGVVERHSKATGSTTSSDYLAAPRKAKVRQRQNSRQPIMDESQETDFLDEVPDTPRDTEKRYRDFGTQIDTQFRDTGAQTDASWSDLAAEKLKQDKKKKKKSTATKEESVRQQHTRAANFTPIDKLKEKATAAAMKKQYSVFDYYKDEGCAQRIARHPVFDNVTILVVIANSIWLGVDADMNQEAILFNAHPVIIAGENFFCIYFTLEIIIRFLAFQRKLNAFKDFWFSFDLCLAILIIVETWVTPVVLLMAGGSSGLPEGTVLLRLIRLVRLVRLTRLTRLLRSFPELMIIVKGLAFAARSVCVFSLLWAIITYAFAIILRQLTEGSAIGTTFFSSVPESINTLLLPAVFGANADVINSITAGNPGLWPIMVFFMALVSVTIMYMLLGVLVDVIGAVASTEKQKIEITYIVGQLREELEKLAIVPEAMELNQADFQKLVLEPGIVRVMHEAGVNVDVLAEMLDLVWEDATAKTSQNMGFSDLVNMVLGMRGSNPATVKDCKEQIRVTNSLIKRCFDSLYDELDERFQQMRTEIQNSLDNDSAYEDDEPEATTEIEVMDVVDYTNVTLNSSVNRSGR
ncbi:Ion_trans domain-containing protein [Durusdinium trenchii]|uniref:Ion_trans domain-containing protein n=1 Tax=Durusdinium trenchii TaxID=1381693 RepID=A0ABP0LR87_9DINO